MNLKLQIYFSFKYFLAPELQAFVSSPYKCLNVREMSTPPILDLSHISFKRKWIFIMYII